MPTRQNPSKQVHPSDEQLWLDFERRPLQIMPIDEIYERADESLLLALSEDERIERKPPRFGGDSLGEYFSMRANTSPDGGLIVSGQHDENGFDGWGNDADRGIK